MLERYTCVYNVDLHTSWQSQGGRRSKQRLDHTCIHLHNGIFPLPFLRSVLHRLKPFDDIKGIIETNFF